MPAAPRRLAPSTTHSRGGCTWLPFPVILYFVSSCVGRRGPAPAPSPLFRRPAPPRLVVLVLRARAVALPHSRPPARTRTHTPPFFSLSCSVNDVLSDESVTDMAFGSSHQLFITKGGEILALGDNKYGQLGVGGSGAPKEGGKAEPTRGAAGRAGQQEAGAAADPSPISLFSSVPRVIPGLLRAKVVACGKHHSAVAMEDGVLFCWGIASSGQVSLARLLAASLAHNAVVLQACVARLLGVQVGVRRLGGGAGRGRGLHVLPPPSSGTARFCLDTARQSSLLLSRRARSGPVRNRGMPRAIQFASKSQVPGGGDH